MTTHELHYPPHVFVHTGASKDCELCAPPPDTILEQIVDAIREVRGPLPTPHEALRADFLAACQVAHVPARVLADRLVHLVVLHGLLPETEPATTENQA